MTRTNPIPAVTMNDGNTLPAIGLGTYSMDGEPGIESILSGIRAGYRLLDTATKYGNEAEVGEAVRRSGLDRSEFRITTKLPGRFHGFDKTLRGFDASLKSMQLDYVDLYLIHWPLARLNLYVESWQAMIRLQQEEKIRSIGVSNFTPANLTRIVDETGVTPAVNQIEQHPYFQQSQQREFNRAHGIVTQAWSPLAEGRDLGRNRVIADIAHAHAVTPAQVALRWSIETGSIPIPRSSNFGRQSANLDVFDFEISGAEMQSMTSLERGRLWGADPDTYESF